MSPSFFSAPQAGQLLPAPNREEPRSEFPIVEPDIEDRGAVSQPVDGDQVDAGRGDGRRRRGRYPALRLGDRPAGYHANRLAQFKPTGKAPSSNSRKSV